MPSRSRSTEPATTGASRTLLFFAPAAYSLGGLATWLDYLVAGLRDRNWGVHLALTGGKFHDVGRYRSDHPMAGVVEVWNRSGSREGRVNALASVIDTIRPDVVASVNIADTFEAAARVREAGRWDIATVMTIHGLQPDLLDDARAYKSILSGVICSNRLACELVVADAGLDRTRVHYAPYGVEMRGVGPTRSPDTRPLRIAWAGRFDREQKRVHDLPEIVAKLENVDFPCEFLIAGGGDASEWLRTALAAVSRRIKIDFLGALSPEQMGSRLYRSADVLLLTSAWETGPLVIWEAMSHGVAVVSSRYLGSGREAALEDGSNSLLFPVGDTAAAAERLRVAADPRTRERLRAAGLRLVRQRYSQERSIEAWDRVLEKVRTAPPPTKSRAWPQISGAGRLDRLFGTRRAELVRSLLRVRYEHRDAGGEWPHSYGERPPDDPLFWRLAESLDARRLS